MACLASTSLNCLFMTTPRCADVRTHRLVMDATDLVLARQDGLADSAIHLVSPESTDPTVPSGVIVKTRPFVTVLMEPVAAFQDGSV